MPWRREAPQSRGGPRQQPHDVWMDPCATREEEEEGRKRAQPSNTPGAKRQSTGGRIKFRKGPPIRGHAEWGPPERCKLRVTLRRGRLGLVIHRAAASRRATQSAPPSQGAACFRAGCSQLRRRL
jgi:hypothetical protein